MKKIKVTVEYNFEVEETTPNEVIEEVADCLEDYGNIIVNNPGDYYDIFDYEESFKIIRDMNSGRAKVEEK